MDAGDLSPMSRGGDSQFVVDTKHPHLRHCAGLFLLDEFQQGTLTNYMDEPAEETATISNATWTSRREIDTNGTDGRIILPEGIIPTAYPFALRFIARYVPQATTSYFAMATTMSYSYYTRLAFITGGAFSLFHQYGGSSNVATSGDLFTEGEYYDVLGVVRANGALEIYHKGVSQGTDSSSNLSLRNYNSFNYGAVARYQTSYFPSNGLRFLQVFHGDPSPYYFEMSQDVYAFIKRPVNNRFLYTEALPTDGFFARRYYDSFIGGRS
jgi:hypothetical protein